MVRNFGAGYGKWARKGWAQTTPIAKVTPHLAPEDGGGGGGGGVWRGKPSTVVQEPHRRPPYGRCGAIPEVKQIQIRFEWVGYRFKLGRHTLSVGDPSQASEVGRDQIEKRFPLSHRLVEVRSCRLRPRRSGVQGLACHAQMTGRHRTSTPTHWWPAFRRCSTTKVCCSILRPRARARGLSAIRVDARSFRPIFQGCTLEQSCRVVRGICLWVAQGVRQLDP